MLSRGASRAGIRMVAVFEAVKGLLVIVVGFGLLSMLHHDVQQVAAHLVKHLHLDAARHYPQIFIEAAARLNDAYLWMLAALAGFYAAIRIAEAWGLWYEKPWAEWLAVVSGCIYLPFEIYELTRGVNVLRLITFTGNVLVVLVMINALQARRRDKVIAR